MGNLEYDNFSEFKAQSCFIEDWRFWRSSLQGTTKWCLHTDLLGNTVCLQFSNNGFERSTDKAIYSCTSIVSSIQAVWYEVHTWPAVPWFTENGTGFILRMCSAAESGRGEDVLIPNRKQLEKVFSTVRTLMHGIVMCLNCAKGYSMEKILMRC